MKEQYQNDDFDMLVLPKNIKSMEVVYYNGNIDTSSLYKGLSLARSFPSR